MPLVIITGYPTSGKTHRAAQLISFLGAKSSALPSPPRIHHITDTSLSIPHSVYDLSSHALHERSDNSAEKDARAKVYAEAKRLLTQNDIVVLDAAGGNYIKGWRYQLYCEAKALRTPSCIVHVGTPVETARAINETRLKAREAGESGDGEEAYEPETWENLVFRYEEPNGMTRWDSPLFTVTWEDETVPGEAIWEAMTGGDGAKVVVRPNQATVVRKAAGEGYLYDLDRATQEVVARIIEWGKDHEGEGGGELDLGEDVLSLPAEKIGLPALQRLRRQFISMNRQNAVETARIKGSFVGYLNDSFAASQGMVKADDF